MTAFDEDPAFAPDATVAVADVSVWFGPKVALSELSCSFGPGVTGLLGPNGAGKTTLMRAITGLVGVNQGTVRIEGHDPRRDRDVYTRMALVPEDEAVPAGLSARQFVRYVASGRDPFRQRCHAIWPADSLARSLPAGNGRRSVSPGPGNQSGAVDHPERLSPRDRFLLGIL